MRLVHADDPRGDPARAVVDGEPGAVGNRLELVEGDLQSVRARERARRHEGVSPPHLVALDPRQAHGHALSGLGPRDRRVVYLHRPHPNLAAVRLEQQPVSLADRPRPERPGDDGADAAER